MADVVDSTTRSRMMSAIRGQDTKPELLVRRLLHRQGYRFRLHVRELPGKPDIVLPKYHAVIFVNGCFWHGHDCHLFRLPATRQDFWEEKIRKNRERDERDRHNLQQSGWRTLTVWECALKGKTRLPEDRLVKELSNWLTNSDTNHVIQGGIA